MIVLYVFLSVILFLFILLCCPVYFYLSFIDSLSVKVKFLFFSLKLFPLKENKVIEEKDSIENENTDEKLKQKSKDNKILGIIKEKGLMGFLKIVSELTKIVLKSTKKFFNRIYIDSITLSMSVVGDDAADTAIKYGKTYAIVSSAVSILLKNVDANKCSINIFPGFNEKESSMNFTAKLHFIPLSIVKIAFSALYEFIKSFYTNKINLNIGKGAAK